MRHPLLAGALAVSLAAPAAAGEPDRRTFTEQVAARLRVALPANTAVSVTGDLQLKVSDSEDSAHELHLENLWRECRGQAEGCASVDRFVRMSAQAHQQPGGSAARPELVRALVKDAGWVEKVMEMVAGGPEPERNAILMRPLLRDLWVVYAIDLPDGIQMMARRNLKELALTEDQVHALALSNLDALGEVPHQPHAEAAGVRVVHVGDSYEASRLLPVRRWAALAETLGGSLVAVAPTRDYVLFTGAGDAAAVARMRRLAARLMEEEGHPLSATLLRWTPRGWVAHEP
jgi:hypothetical protein